MVAPSFPPPTNPTSNRGHPVLKVCHNNRPEEELFRAQAFFEHNHRLTRGRLYIVVDTIHKVCQLRPFVVCA